MQLFDPFGDSFLEDPYPHFAQHVRDQPVFYAEDLGYWVISRHGDCRRALREFVTFSASNALAPVTVPCPAARAALADGGFRSIPTITNVDPPAHTRTRRIAQAAFTPRRVAQMEPVVRQLVRDYLHRHQLVGRSDIVAELTWELPALVLFHILGVPASDITEVKEGAKTRLSFMFGRATEDEQAAIAAGMTRFWRYCEDLADDRRARPRATTTRATRTDSSCITPDETGAEPRDLTQEVRNDSCSDCCSPPPRDAGCSTIPTCSTFGDATPATTSRSASDPTCASARRSLGSKRGSCSKS